MTRYRTIVADPPWPFVWQGGVGGRRARPTNLGYETMSYTDICALVADPFRLSSVMDVTLLMWVTQEALHGGHAHATAKAWGFPWRVGELIWRKPNFGTGAFPRIGHETCVIYKRGDGSLRADAPRDVHSVQTWKQPYTTNNGKTHSAKPDGFYDLVERGFEGPYLEMFARRARLGDWSYWGDQSLGTAAAVA